jgi:PAS domain S-box-containing protein
MTDGTGSLIDVDSPDAAVANMRAILNPVVDAVVTIDEQGEIRLANHATTQMFGFSHEELIGSNISILMPPPYRDEHDAHVRRYLEPG